jgi:SAM-dependent methyltransferase
MKYSKDQFLLLRNAYAEGQSITKLIKSWNWPIDFDAITLIYELQAGSYTNFSKRESLFVDNFTSEIVSYISKYLDRDSILLDCGTGESTNFLPILKKLSLENAFGIDASISRLSWARQNAKEFNVNLDLAAADMGCIPLPDKSIDASLTIHSLEPNGKKEADLVAEIGRVTRNYIFFVEPDFESGSQEQRERMSSLNFITGLDAAIANSGYSILEKLPIKNNSNALNCASLTVVDVRSERDKGKTDPVWVDPIYKLGLQEKEHGLINALGFWYPNLLGIPLLRKADTQYILSPA